MVGLVATARTDSSYINTVQRTKAAWERVSYIPLVFPSFRSEPRFHLLKGFLQKDFVDKRITENSFKVVQSRYDFRDVFPIRFSVDCFVAQVRQTFRGAVRDQFLN